MDAYLKPLVSCRLMKIIKLERKILEKSKKSKNTVKITLELCTTLYVQSSSLHCTENKVIIRKHNIRSMMGQNVV